MHHTTFVFTSVLGGHGRWRYRHWCPEVGPHRVMLIEPGETHVTTNVATPASFDALFVDPRVVADVLERNGLRSELHFRAPDIEDRLIFSRLCELQRAFEQRDVPPEVRQAAFEETIVSLAERVGHGRPAFRVGRQDALIEGAREEIHNRLEAQWASDGSSSVKAVSVKEMAERRGLGSVSFIRAFRAAFGTTPFHYAQILKIGRSLELIRNGPRDGGTSITDVAAAAGFYDACQFSRIFRHQVGLSPREYAFAVRCGWSHR
jgi:AraC-like DNA-binding protein